MDIHFEWDPDKDAANVRKHGVPFREAVNVFSDPFLVAGEDWEHSVSESRFWCIGSSRRQRILLVIYEEREERIRIISARLATRRERRRYEG